MEITRVAKRQSNKKREHFNRPMDNLKHISIHIIGISEGQKREMVKCIWWNYDWKLSKPEEGNNQGQKVHRICNNKVNQNKPTLTYSIIKMAEVRYKESIRKASRDNTESYKRELL